MESKRNKISFDFANSPELKAIFSGWEVGKSYELKIGFQLDELTNDGASCTVTEITAEEPEAEEPTTVTPDTEHPVMAVFSSGGGMAKPEPYVAP